LAIELHERRGAVLVHFQAAVSPTPAGHLRVGTAVPPTLIANAFGARGLPRDVKDRLALFANPAAAQARHDFRHRQFVVHHGT
jgi:hypothetical protein